MTQTGLIIAHFGTHVELEDHLGKHHQAQLPRSLPTLVVGDNVEWVIDEQHQQAIVTALIPRKTELVKANNMGQLKTIAANVNQLVIVMAPEPEYSLLLLDKYLVAAETIGAHPLIIFNKIDLLENFIETQTALQNYTALGYDLVFMSVEKKLHLDVLPSHLQNHTSIIVGQSGVGKSSLLSTLLPKEKIQIGAISESTGFGKHTTSTSRLYHLPFDGDLIDSPGVREFGIWQLTPDQVFHGFCEFRNFYKQCKFRDCQHNQEPDCAIKLAVERGSIDANRFDNYKKIIASLKDL